MTYPQLNNKIRATLRSIRDRSAIIRAMMLIKQSTTEETERFAVQTERTITIVSEKITTIEKTLIDHDMTAKTKFIQTLADQVTVSGGTKTTLLDISQGTATFTPEDMAIGQSYHGKIALQVAYDSNKDYNIFLGIGAQEVQVTVPVGTPGPVADAFVSLDFILRFTGGPDPQRECYFVGEYRFVDIAGAYAGPYHLRIPFTLLQVDATTNQPFILAFQGTDAANECKTIDLSLNRT